MFGSCEIALRRCCFEPLSGDFSDFYRKVEQSIDKQNNSEVCRKEVSMKYVIEIENMAVNECNEKRDALFKAKNFRTLVFDEVGLNRLTPLEDEVLEAEKKAYDRGYRQGRKICDAEVRDEAYRDGLKHGYDKCLEDMKDNGDGLGTSVCIKCLYHDKPAKEWPCCCCERMIKDMFEEME